MGDGVCDNGCGTAPTVSMLEWRQETERRIGSVARITTSDEGFDGESGLNLIHLLLCVVPKGALVKALGCTFHICLTLTVSSSLCGESRPLSPYYQIYFSFSIE